MISFCVEMGLSGGRFDVPREEAGGGNEGKEEIERMACATLAASGKTGMEVFLIIAQGAKDPAVLFRAFGLVP